MLDYTSPIKALVAKYGVDYDAPIEDYAPDCPLPPMRPVVWTKEHEAERKLWRDSLPNEMEAAMSWANHVLAAPAFARPALVADQVEIMRPIHADAERWCREALRLAKGGNHAE